MKYLLEPAYAVCTFLLIILPHHVFSQAYNLDSLYHDIKGREKIDSNYYLKLDTFKVAIDEYKQNNFTDILFINSIQIWAIHYSVKRPVECIAAFEESITESEQISYDYGVAVGNHEIGMIYFRQGFYNKAIQKFHFSSEKFKKIEKWWEYGFSLIDIGNIYYSQGVFNNANHYFKKALQVFSEHIAEGKLEVAAAVCYNNLGLIAYDKEQYNTALSYFNSGLEMRKKIELKPYYGHSLRYIAQCYKKLGKSDSALCYYTQAVYSDRKFGPKEELINSYLDLGDFYVLNNTVDDALKSYYRAYIIAMNYELYPKIVKTTNKLALFYTSLNQLDSAKHYFKIAFDFARKSNQIDGELQAAERLVEIYKKEADTKMQLMYLEYIIEIERKIKQNEISKHQLEFEVNQRVKVSRLFERKNKQKLTIVIVVSILALGLLITVFIIYRSRRKYIDLNSKLNRQSIKLGIQTKELENANLHLTDSNEEIAQQREEIKAQAENLADSLKKLRQLNEFKEGLMAMIVHDLKLPLNNVLNLAENEMVAESGRQMLNMVNNILDVQRFENAKMPVQKITCNLNQLIINALRQTNFLAQQKNIQCINHINANYELNADPDLIERVFINLVSNAIKYTPRNGKIEINIQQDSENTLKVFVTDNGPGIPENLKERVFDKFMQIIAKKSGQTRSSGLGLTFCKLAVEAHDGEIGLDTKIGEGTSFWFTLPVEHKLDGNNEVILKPVIFKGKIDKKSLKKIEPFINRLKLLDVYEVSKIQQIITELRILNITGIDSWLKALENSAYSVNQEEFMKLLDFFC